MSKDNTIKITHVAFMAWLKERARRDGYKISWDKNNKMHVEPLSGSQFICPK